MAIELRASSVVGAINGGNVTVNFTGNGFGMVPLLPKDVVLVFGGKPGRAAGGIGPLDQGYTTITTTSTVAAGPNFGVWYKRMGDVPDQSVLLRGSANASDGTAYGAYILKGVSDVVTDATTQSVKGNSTNPAAPSIITTSDNAWVIAMAGSQVSDTSVTSILGYSSLIQRDANDTLDITVAGNIYPASVAGTIAAGAFSNWSSASWISATVALQPATNPIVFMEPGGDAFGTFNNTSAFWYAGYGGTGTRPSVVTDIVHGTHNSSTKIFPNTSGFVDTGNIIHNIGARISFYIYFNVLPNANAEFAVVRTSGGANVAALRLTSAGVLQLIGTAQMGSNGSTLSTGNWYRISLSYTSKTQTINEYRVYVDGVLDITATNASTLNFPPRTFYIGNRDTNSTLDFRFSDLYIDGGTGLDDVGDIWVTAKRPVSNGSLNEFNTQLGAGGSGYGTGHSPQVNERPYSSVSGWSVGPSVLGKSELYNVEGPSVGDIDITGKIVVGYAGWVSAEQPTLPVVRTKIAVGSARYENALSTGYLGNITAARLFENSTSYPNSTGADIGIVTDAVTSMVSFNLFEAGIMVAYKNEALPSVISISSRNLTLLGVGV